MSTLTDHRPDVDTSEADGPAYSAAARSESSASTASLVLEHLDDYVHKNGSPYRDTDPLKEDPLNRSHFEQLDIDGEETTRPLPVDKRYRQWLLFVGIACAAGWVLALVLFITSGSYKHRSSVVHDPHATSSIGSGKKISLSQLQHGAWYPRAHSIRWIHGPNGEDGRLLEIGNYNKDFVVVESVQGPDGTQNQDITLIKGASFRVEDYDVHITDVWPSPDLKTVLVLSDRQSNWRHSFTGLYWIYDVATGHAQALDPTQSNARVQLAKWSPTSRAVVFVRENNLFIRHIDFANDHPKLTQITTDGGEEMFNGVPDWVYEEEVFAGNSVTWISDDGNYIAFLRTNESRVAEYPVQYFLSRPSGTQPDDWMENYPEVRQIKYPKAGTPNPVVHLRFYDVRSESLFDVPIENDFDDDDRLITEVLWAGTSGKLLVRETNRQSDFLRMVIIDVDRRTGSIVRSENVTAIDGGWFEVSESTKFVPADPDNGRPHHGYIDTVIHEGYDHLAYFSPLESSGPRLITTGNWEVVSAPSAVDLVNNLVYFVATKEGSTQRHVYSVKMDGTQVQPLTDITDDGYYDVSFSKGAGFALLSYQGPHIPWQRVISTPSYTGAPYSRLIEDNKQLSQLASATELPLKVFSTIWIDGFELNVLERRPPHFSDKNKYPVLFYLYGGPGSQQVDQKFKVDFQAYVAATLGYIVVTVDGRGTGFIGRKGRCIIRGDIGHYESHDQIATAKEWAKKKYVDASRMAIWGWSYGGYLTLKTLEQDAGQTFSYGMAVAPVTNWLFYDSIYTERWLRTPQNNPQGYERSAIANVSALGQATRFLMMHGVADDNVHMQSTLTLLDRLNLATIENYDVHVFPDSDHSIYFHNANRIVYDKLAWWLTNAFNGEWARLQHPTPQ